MKKTPYLKSYEKTKDLDQFLEYDVDLKECRFIGDSMTIFIPMRYEAYGFLEVSDTCKYLGLVDIIVNDKYQTGFNILAEIESEFTDQSKIMVGNTQYLVLELSHGDRFMCNTKLVKNKNIAFAVWVESITRGKLIYNMDYFALTHLLDLSGPNCAADLKINHSIIEIIYSHLSRDINDINVQYRHTDMTNDFQLIPLRSVADATTNTASKITGSYLGDALNNAIINPSQEKYPLETILRS